MITLKVVSWKLQLSLLALFIFCFLKANSQDSLKTYKPVPLNRLFYNLDENIVGSFSYYYGINYLLAGVSTYALVEGNADWNWYQFSMRNKAVYNSGYASVILGEILPTAVPVGLYVYGRADKNVDLQVTALALGQAALLGLGVSSLLKVFTGRVPPVQLKYTDDFQGDFRFGFMKGGADNGWPSSHTTVAFATATALIELYPDNTALKICSLTYASFIGLGVSTNIHWFSDVVSGALIGYGIGKTVGISFRHMKENKPKIHSLNFSVNATGASLIYKL